AHTLLSDFVHNYEVLYVQRKVSRIHFVPQCMHALTHTPTETWRIGSLICTCQFTMERIIGNLGAEIRQPSNPFANLTQRALRRAQMNALETMLPDLELAGTSQAPQADLGDNFYLLHPREPGARPVSDDEDIVILRFIENYLGTSQAREAWVISMESCIQRWARLRLPNGQICRSAWKEVPNKMTRISRNVKAGIPLSRLLRRSLVSDTHSRSSTYFRCKLGGVTETLALVSKYSPPDLTLLNLSSGVIWACRGSGENWRQLEVINVKRIIACVAMIP
ncbi:hypothetical protein FKP32DRAFT_1534628, partial [Trametes sanguinea]